MEGHITVYGYISPYQDDDASYWGEVNLKNIQNQIQNQAEAETLVVHINSMGGDVNEGFAIHDVLRSTGKKIITQIEGMCASIATVIALAGDERRMTENSEYMIHCPMMWGGGTASEIQDQATYLKEVEGRVIDFYAQKTGSSKEDIEAMMKAETYMDSDKAKSLGFITEVVTTMKAVAILKQKHMSTKTMTVKDFEEKFDEKSEGIVTRILNAIKGKAKMIEVTTAGGEILDFGESIEEESQIAIGNTATVEGSPASGEYVLSDGRTLVFENGAVTEIKEAGGEETVEDLKQQIADKDQEIADLKSAQAKHEDELAKMETKVGEQIKKGLEDFKKEMKSDMNGKKLEVRESDGGEEPTVRRGTKVKE
jgi:ATP-dependent Clp endopeptidase proteolytic subunit ClpP